MKVLFLIDSLRKGGKERQLVELIKGLSATKGITMEIVVMNEEIAYKAILEHEIKIHYLIRKKKKDLSIFKKLFKICNNFNPDIIHTWDTMTTFYALPYRILKRKVLINGSIRFAASNIKSNIKLYYFNKLLFSFSDFVIANSKAGLTTFFLKESYKNRFIYNGFDLNRISSLENVNHLRKKLNIGAKKVVCMVSSFEDHKDNQTFVRAALEILKQRDDIVFLAVGKGKNLEFCKELAKDAPEMRFLGQQDNVESIINISDIGVLCSNVGQYGEGISNAILEFYSMKKPMLATDSGGTLEVVLNNKSGFLLAPNKVQDLVDKLNLLIDDSEMRNNFGKAGFDLLNTNFGMDKMISNYLNLYNEIYQD